MQSIEQASNAELLSALTGPRPAQLLMERFGGLAPLARASLWLGLAIASALPAA